ELLGLLPPTQLAVIATTAPHAARRAVTGLRTRPSLIVPTTVWTTASTTASTIRGRPPSSCGNRSVTSSSPSWSLLSNAKRRYKQTCRKPDVDEGLSPSLSVGG